MTNSIRPGSRTPNNPKTLIVCLTNSYDNKYFCSNKFCDGEFESIDAVNEHEFLYGHRNDEFGEWLCLVCEAKRKNSRRFLTRPEANHHVTSHFKSLGIEVSDEMSGATENPEPTIPGGDTQDVNRKVIGIDFGRTTSSVSIIKGHNPTIIEVDGESTISSNVAFMKDKVFVGKATKNQVVANHKNLFYASKMLIGRKYEDVEMHKLRKSLSYTVVKASNGDALVQAQGKTFSTAKIASMILKILKTSAEEFLHQSVEDAVICVPAYFNQGQRQVIKYAGQTADLNVIGLIDDPVAAALSYGLNSEDGIVAVCDFGAIFEITILDIKDGHLKIRTTGSDMSLGGEDFDDALVDFLVDMIKNKHGVDVSKDPEAISRLREASEKAKIDLSGANSHEIMLPFLFKAKGSLVNLYHTVSRSEYERLIDPLVKKTISLCEKVIRDAEISKSEIKDVLLVGGMAKMPKVQEIVRSIFDRMPNLSVNPDLCVCFGAAIQADILSNLVTDVVPLSLGIETFGGVFKKFINRNTTIPNRTSQICSTEVDGQTKMEIKIYQGERIMAADNKLLGQFQLIGIPPAPRGVPQIEVTFDVDAESIKVTARDKRTGKERQHLIHLESSDRPSPDKIENLVNSAALHEENDRARKDLIVEVKTVLCSIESEMEKCKGLSAKEYDRLKGEIMRINEQLNNENESAENVEKATSDFQQSAVKLIQSAQKRWLPTKKSKDLGKTKSKR